MIFRIARDWLAPAFVLCGLVLGGSSSGGLWANLALQWLSGTVLIGLLASRMPMPVPRILIAISAAAIALPILQIVPLPPSMWMLLPQRAVVAEGFALARFPLPWLPLSLDVDATLAVLGSTLVPAAGMAVFAASTPRGLHRAMTTVLAFAVASILLGAAQKMAGEGTVLQPYTITNPGKATGLFANSNHLGTLLVMAVPCAVLLLPGRANRLAAAVLVALLLGGAVLTGSRAAIGLAVLTMAVSAAWIHAPARARSALLALLAAGAVVGAAGGLSLAVLGIAPPASGKEEQRSTMIQATLAAAREYFPAGSGGGSFLRVYQYYEDPAGASPQYRNHAHSDYAEILLEYGVPGALLILAVIGWWAARVRAAWRGGPEFAAVRCGVIMLGAVLAHSLVDYPLRTAALALLAAGAIMMAARPGPARGASAQKRRETSADDDGHLRISL